MMSPQRMSGRIEKIVYPGRRLVRKDGKVIFTDFGLPGEEVEMEFLGERKSYAEARTTAILTPSPRRVVPRCDHYRACSIYQEIDYPLQLEIKKAQLVEILERGLPGTPGTVDIVPSPELWGYRNRIGLTVLWENGRPSFAYHEPGETADFIPAGRCALVPDRVNDLADGLLALAGKNGWTSLRGVDIRSGRSSGDLMAVLKVDSQEGLDVMAAAVRESLPEAGLVGLAASVVSKDKKKRMVLTGRDHLEEKAGGLTFVYGAFSFFQVNTGMLEIVIKDVRSILSGMPSPVVADMYCGVGTFGLAAASASARVLGIESDRENTRYLKRNLALNDISNYTVCEGPSEEWIEDVLENRPDAVIFDPPRRGLDRSIIAGLNGKRVGKIIYISCNPSTLVRDLAGLSEGYDLELVRAYDFFPHTPHIETMAVLNRK